MTRHILRFKPAFGFYYHHDPGVALFRDGELVFGSEEERFSRNKHTDGEFSEQAICAALDHEGIHLPDVDKIVLPYDPALAFKKADVFLKRHLKEILNSEGSIQAARSAGSGGGSPSHPLDTLWRKLTKVRKQIDRSFLLTFKLEQRLARIDTPVPPVETRSHHLCHAAGAFHPTDFEEALVLTHTVNASTTAQSSGTAHGRASNGFGPSAYRTASVTSLMP